MSLAGSICLPRILLVTLGGSDALGFAFATARFFLLCQFLAHFLTSCCQVMFSLPVDLRGSFAHIVDSAHLPQSLSSVLLALLALVVLSLAAPL